ncbi:YuzF family protein [Halalkalibacter hemicellulosilyticus]|uniref:DUF2642 domain-containing protein n=1 Tax=Halalkalibacter hemicellulosilyticusJCM 9152 TaxID=1236971 RepID=W4QG87_9BACI|nr:YuzF family protein [Halalkalibacter hemicellulosilyticus]GAE30912.1 hypothetical protein JCM9152_2344 [Halalkalibacter hemicellulosilyticusJCM 9152]
MNNPTSASANRPQLVSMVDPFVVQTLQSIVQSTVVIETTRGNLRGTLLDVKPDHVVIQVGNQSSFFVRIQEIVWVMPS